MLPHFIQLPLSVAGSAPTAGPARQRPNIQTKSPGGLNKDGHHISTSTLSRNKVKISWGVGPQHLCLRRWSGVTLTWPASRRLSEP